MIEPRPKRLSELQAFVVGCILDNFGYAINEDDDVGVGALWDHLEPRPASAEELATTKTFAIRAPTSMSDAWKVHSALGTQANVIDDQLEHRVGRGDNPETRAHLRAEMRALEGVQAWMLNVLRYLDHRDRTQESGQ